MKSVRQFEIVRALAKHRHFGRAAAALGTLQPSLTRSLKDIEDSLGAPLFNRADMEPTIFGKMVLQCGDAVLRSVTELMREIDLAKGLDSGTLIVGSGVYPAAISVDKAIGLLTARHPRLFVQYRQADWNLATRMVASGEVDVAVAGFSAATDDDRLDTETIRDSQLHFYCAVDHPLAARRPVTFEDIVDFPWVGSGAPGRLRSFLPRQAPCGYDDPENNRFVPRILVQTFSAAREIVLSGNALGVALPFQLDREVRERRCVILPVDLPWLRLGYGFIVRRGRMVSPPARAFMDIVREIERGLPLPDAPSLKAR